MPSTDSRKILIVAAEASSCLYAQRLLEHWKKHNIHVEAFGIGDQAMAELGFERLANAEDLAVVGLQEVISHWGVIKKAFYDVLNAAQTRKPQVVLLLDYPGFNLRLAKRLKALGVPVVYYISPQVWAWRTGRVKDIKRDIDKMLVVFPFEVDFYKSHGMNVEFVGHPLLDELNPKHFAASARRLHRARYGIQPDEVMLALMPGSRRSELKHHLDTQLAAARALSLQHPGLKIALFIAPNFSKEELETRLEGLDFPLMLIKDEPFSMIDLADVVLCASGTATLMVGLLEKPMVIMYKMNGFTAFLAKRFVKSTKYFGLINLVLDDLVVPEVFQGQADPPELVKLLNPLIKDVELRLALAGRLKTAKSRLGDKGATARVAAALEPYWGPAT
ncbi:MAG TPA: lipid-A-disaccharide synthase [Bdellovibrionales bacterium]|nr:lipid-A-disaccharide synthase [Bdellovibrionales bacterium]